MISRANQTCLLLLLIASICSCADDEFRFRDEMSCVTEGKTCIKVSDCKYVDGIIERSGIWSEEAQTYLRSHNCGYEGEDPKICCPEEESMQNRLASEESQSSDEENNNSVEPGEENTPSLSPKMCGIQFFSKIVGGMEVESGEFPWLVALEYKERGTARLIIGCAGTLITQRYVLTAAHCVLTTSNVNLKKVRLGEDNILSVDIESSITHKNFRNPNYYDNDIALLRLTKDVPVGPLVQPICLPSTSDTGGIYWAAGWGQTETQRHSDVKLKIELPYFEFNQCAAKYWPKNINLGKGHMCAGGQAAKDTCKGDSGGPLMRQIEAGDGNERWIVDGVLSLGADNCGLAEWPAVYTKVHHYLPWIFSKLKS